MAVTLHLRWDEGVLGVGSSSGYGELRYVAISDDPENDGRDEVLDKLLTDAPSDLFGLVIDDAQVTERISDNQGVAVPEGHWDCIISYINPVRKQPFPLYSKLVTDPRPIRFTFRNAGGGSITAKRSKEFINEATAGPGFTLGTQAMTRNMVGFTAYMGGMGANKKGTFSVHGISIAHGAIEIGLETVVHQEEVDTGWFIKAADYASKNAINKEDWHGFASRTMKMVNFDAKQRADAKASKENPDPSENDELWDVNFTFEFQGDSKIDFTGMPQGSTIPKRNDRGGDPINLYAQGHEIIDLLFCERQVQLGPQLFVDTDVLCRVAVHRMNDEEDFAAELGI